MKVFTVLLVFSLFTILAVSAQPGNKALILIDIQDFYFPGGGVELSGADEAATIAAKVLKVCRDNEYRVVHVKHKAKAGEQINEMVKALPDEKIIVKNEVNAFLNTDLKPYLEKNNVKELIIVGMQTHMCLEAGVRAAADYGYKVTVISDACATRDLKFKEKRIPAEFVHYSTLATLKSYAEILYFEEFEKNF